MFLVAAIMQGILLFLCICWKVRQHRLHIDDFGHPLRTELPPPEPPVTQESEDRGSVDETVDAFDDDLVSISYEEAEQAPLLRDRKKRSKKRKWWTKWTAGTAR